MPKANTKRVFRVQTNIAFDVHPIQNPKYVYKLLNIKLLVKLMITFLLNLQTYTVDLNQKVTSINIVISLTHWKSKQDKIWLHFIGTTE